VQRFIQRFGCAVYSLPIMLMQGMAEVLDSGDDFVAIRGAEKIALVAQVLASVPQE